MDKKILDHAQVLQLLPDRDPFAHKGNFGRLLLLCGSRGYTGAAALAAMGCLRSGAGLVFLGVPESIYAIEAVKLTEAIVLPLPDSQGRFAASAVSNLEQLLFNKDAVLIGPGLGQSEGALAVLQYVMENYSGPVVVDADGINLLAAHRDLLRRRNAVTILTPHAGEFARLAPQYQDRPVDFAKDYGCILVLKGHHTLTTDGRICYENRTGNPGMAVGGSGDVLAGILTGLLGQGIAPLQAAGAAVWLHGAAGDLCAQRLGQYAMLPTDLLCDLPRLLK